jgi:hypothetical protein
MNYGLLRMEQDGGDFKLIKDDRSEKTALGPAGAFTQALTLASSVARGPMTMARIRR